MGKNASLIVTDYGQRPWDDALVTVNERPELVFGLVAALGTNLDEVQEELEAALRSVNYTASVIRLSALLAEEHNPDLDDPSANESKMAKLMRYGDELCRAAGPNAVAALGISRLVKERQEATEDSKRERQAHATILRSIKRRDEVTTLREIYGPRFVLIGGWATRGDRQAEVRRRLLSDRPGQPGGWYAEQTEALMERDEEDARQPGGQGVRSAFELADVYIAVRAGHPVHTRISRLVNLLFGAPFQTPTKHEEAMFLASGVGLRSSAAGRQVGAVVVDEDGEVLVTGTNEVPKAGGGQYWAGETPDYRDFSYGYDVNDRLKLEIVADVLDRLKSADWLTAKAVGSDDEPIAERALREPLRGSRINDLLEFGRIAHAEMAAICTAARRGTALRKGVMYSTTYPCHQCARLIIATGIKKVIYVDPYPKSQVQEMFPDEVSEGPSPVQDTVAFEPFEGIAPRLFRQLFTMSQRSRDKITGRFSTWDSTASTPWLLAAIGVTPSPIPMENRVISEFSRNLSDSDWLKPG
jgi:deoxycytidylate deaminase